MARTEERLHPVEQDRLDEEWIDQNVTSEEELAAAELRAGLERVAEVFAALMVVAICGVLTWFLALGARYAWEETHLLAAAAAALGSLGVGLAGAAVAWRGFLRPERPAARVRRALSEIQLARLAEPGAADSAVEDPPAT